MAGHGRRLVVVGSVVAVGAATLTVGAPAHAAPTLTKTTLNSVSFIGATQTLKSTTGKRLKITVSANAFTPFTSPSHESVQVGRSTTPETHTWTFTTPNGLTYDPSTGKGSVRSGTSFGGFGKLKLNLTANGKKTKTKCGTSYESDSQPVDVAGVLIFNTQSGKHGWGKVGHKKRRRFRGHSYVQYTMGDGTGCPTPSFPCQTSRSWLASQTTTNSSLSISGEIGTKSSFLNISRNTTLKKPAGASRSDFITLDTPRQHFRVRHHKARVTVEGAGIIKGSATLQAADKGTSGTQPCGKHETNSETTTTWKSSYTNGKKRLTGKEQIEGSLFLPNIRSTATFAPYITETK